ncbi:MAG: hypothetical protein LWY06_14330, partial [Firmicutes bacterium]|nr:hypothetical protein [Bacillota bacterium]
MIIRNWEKHKVLLPILITVLFLLTLAPSYGSDDNPVKEKPDRQKILILHYSKNKEKITVCQQDENRITEADYGYIGNVREADRYLRYFYNDKVNVLHIESGRLNEKTYLRFGSNQRAFLIGFEALMTGKNLKNNQIFQEKILEINDLYMGDFSFMNDSSYMKFEELCNFFTTGNDFSYLLTSPYIGGEENLICRVSFNRNKKYLPDVHLDFFGNSEKPAESIFFPEIKRDHKNQYKYEAKDPINPAESKNADNLAFLNYKQNGFSLYRVSEKRLLTQDDITDWNKLISNLKYYKKTRFHSLIEGKLSFDAKRTINNTINFGDIDAQTKTKIIRGLNEF